jgi:putative LysE/RhtB family amino acid efflux pump
MTELGALFAKGWLLGFSVAAPVGPIGVLCIRRSLEGGFLAGLAGGLGTALADGVFAAIAAFGIAAAAEFLAAADSWLRLGGGLFLLWIGIQALRQPAGTTAAAVYRRGLAGLTVATFALTIANPAAVFGFAAMFAGLGLVGAAGSSAAAGILVASVFAGSLTWWALLSGTVSRLRRRFDQRVLLWVNRASGTILVLCALYALASLVVP